MKHARQDYDHIQDPSGKIPDDEPVFLLRAQDQLASQHLRDYADHAEMRGASPELVKMVRDHADKFDAWPTKKLPDLPTAENGS